MGRIIPLLTLIPTIFTFIAIILINVGGVGRSFSGGFANPQNRNLDLLSFNYTVSPGSGTSFYTISIFLNRQCRGGQSQLAAQRGSPAGQQCPAYASRTLRDSSSVLTPNLLLSTVSPFRFSTVNLDAPFALYVVAAICVLLAMIMGLVSASSDKQTKGPRILGTLFSTLTFIFVLSASAVITWQTLHLSDQIQNDTLDTVSLRNTTYGASFNDYIPYTITIEDINVGKPVQGLTWAAVVAMSIAVVMWVYAMMKAPKRTDVAPPAYKEERMPVSPSERCVQGGV